MCSNRCAKPVRALRLVHRAHVIPQVDGHERQTVVLMQQHRQAVGQGVAFIGERRHLQRLGWSEL